MKIFCDSQQINKSISIEYNDVVLKIPSKVYHPHEDSYMLANCVKQIAYGKFLDMGCGSGLQGIIAAKKKEVTQVTCIDSSLCALRAAKKNAKRNKIRKKIKFIQSNLFDEVHGKFDVIAFNPPYLPTDELDESIETYARATWDGGRNGRKILDPFLEQFEKYLRVNGVLLLVQSSLNNSKKTINALKKKGFTVQRAAHEKFFFEELIILKAQKVS